MLWSSSVPHLFFFNDTSTTEIYTLSLHDALPISVSAHARSPAVSVVVPPTIDAGFWSTVRAAILAWKASSRIRAFGGRSEEHTSELQSHSDLVCRLLLEKKKARITVLLKQHAVLL